MKAFICTLLLSCAALGASAADFNLKAIQSGLSENSAAMPALSGNTFTVKQAAAALEDGSLPEGGYVFEILLTLFNKGEAPAKEELLGVYKGYSFSDSGKISESYLATVKYPNVGEMFQDSVKIAPFKKVSEKNTEAWLLKKMEAYPFAKPLKHSLKTQYPALWDKEAKLEVRKYGKYLIAASSSLGFMGFRHAKMSYYYEKVADFAPPAPAPDRPTPVRPSGTARADTRRGRACRPPPFRARDRWRTHPG